MLNKSLLSAPFAALTLLVAPAVFAQQPPPAQAPPANAAPPPAAPNAPPPAAGPPAAPPAAPAPAYVDPSADTSRAEPAPVKADHARFRGGIRGEGGVLYAPGPGVSLAAIGVAGEVGVQFSDLVGLYWAPSFDIIFGDLGGVNVGSAFMVDFTLDDMFQLGVGPDFGSFAALGASSNGISGAGGSLYGARLHFGVIPAFGEGVDKVRRKGLIIGLDVRMLFGEVGFAELEYSGSANSNGASGSASADASTTDFILSPMVYIGYQAF